MELFTLFAFYGILASLIYLAGLFLRRLTNFFIATEIIIDIICFVLIGLVFSHITLTYTYGIIRFYLCLGFILGFVASTETLKNLVANMAGFVYNKLRHAIIKLKPKLNFRRKNYDRGKINQTS